LRILHPVLRRLRKRQKLGELRGGAGESFNRFNTAYACSIAIGVARGAGGRRTAGGNQ
jgi:hypothetical protein